MSSAAHVQTESRIERREFKFIISLEARDQVRDALQPFCVLDRHSAVAPDLRYTIESLYLDTPRLALFHANEVERLDRVKLRVRHYPDNALGDAYLEVKRRYHDVIDKTRGRVPHDAWQALVGDPFADLGPYGADPAVERFFAITHAMAAQPTMLVRYEREAWIGHAERYARVTFDTNIRAQRCEVAEFAPEPRGWRALDDNWTLKQDQPGVVLELKFESRAPTWMMGIVSALDLWRGAYSKYGNGVLAHFVPPESRMEAIG